MGKIEELYNKKEVVITSSIKKIHEHILNINENDLIFMGIPSMFMIHRVDEDNNRKGFEELSNTMSFLFHSNHFYGMINESDYYNLTELIYEKTRGQESKSKTHLEVSRAAMAKVGFKIYDSTDLVASVNNKPLDNIQKNVFKNISKILLYTMGYYNTIYRASSYELAVAKSLYPKIGRKELIDACKKTDRNVGPIIKINQETFPKISGIEFEIKQISKNEI